MAILPGDLDFQIALIPPVSRSVGIAGRTAAIALYAQQLFTLWKVAEGNGVPLSQAFRLLSVQAVQIATSRTMVEIEHPAGLWRFPVIAELLPELQTAAWEAMLDGSVAVDGIPAIRGKRRRIIPADELTRYCSDWAAARLTKDGHDVFIDVTVRRPPTVPVNWRDWPRDRLETVVQEVERTFPAGAQPSFDREVLPALRAQIPGLPRDAARSAVREYAPRLIGRRGHRRH
jgi:hypothetical protein